MSLEDIVKSLATNTLQFQQDTKQFQQETRTSIQGLENQVGQMATAKGGSFHSDCPKNVVLRSLKDFEVFLTLIICFLLRILVSVLF